MFGYLPRHPPTSWRSVGSGSTRCTTRPCTTSRQEDRRSGPEATLRMSLAEVTTAAATGWKALLGR
ncbi:MAG: hypothetical protein R2695_11090 [Acidimicrobiales bacterium]